MSMNWRHLKRRFFGFCKHLVPQSSKRTSSSFRSLSVRHEAAERAYSVGDDKSLMNLAQLRRNFSTKANLITDRRMFCSGKIDDVVYIIYQRQTADGLPEDVYNGTLDGLPVTCHFLDNEEQVAQWRMMSNICDSRYVLQVILVTKNAEGRFIVFTERVDCSLKHWGKNNTKVDKVTRYVDPFLRIIYLDVITAMFHVLNYTGDCHGNITSETVFVVGGRGRLSAPNITNKREDHASFRNMTLVIHSGEDEIYPRELKHFTDVLDSKESTLLALITNHPFLKDAKERMDYRCWVVMSLLDKSVRGLNKRNMLANWLQKFGQHTEMWKDKLEKKYGKKLPGCYNLAHGNDGDPFDFVIFTRNSCEHGLSVLNLYQFDMEFNDLWEDFLPMLSEFIREFHVDLNFKEFTEFPMRKLGT